MAKNGSSGLIIRGTTGIEKLDLVENGQSTTTEMDILEQE